MLKDFYRDTPVLSSILTILLVALLFILADMLLSKPQSFDGYVIDKHYKAEQISTGTGTAVGSNGTVGVVTITEIDPEKFLIMVRTIDGQIITVESEPELYYKKEIGDKITSIAFKGIFTGATWSLKGVE